MINIFKLQNHNINMEKEGFGFYINSNFTNNTFLNEKRGIFL